MGSYAADVVELLDGLGIARAAVIGLSMGGLVAMEVAVSYPQRCFGARAGAWWPCALLVLFF
jgi:pimeloyl-ACP methyl ester carboxylesterase